MMSKRKRDSSSSKQKSGVEDVGMEYQYKVITYLASYLSENPTVEIFSIFSNLSDIPGFDDLIFKVWYKGKRYPYVYLGQIKHRSNKINFETEKHKLTDYKRDLVKIINNKEKLELLQDVPDDNIEFLFYSNNFLLKAKSIVIDKEVPYAPLLCSIEHDHNFTLPITVSKDCYKFTAVGFVDDDDLLFLNKTHLLLNQPCNRKIIYEIKNLYHGEFSKEMVFGILRYVREYFRIPTVTNITKDIFETELLRIRISKYIISPTNAIQMNIEQARLWNQMTLDYDITLVDDRINAEGMVCGCFLQKVNDLYNCDFKWNDCIYKNRRLISDFNIQPFIDRSKLIGIRYWLAAPDTIDLLLEEMWKYADIPLMLKMDGEISLLTRYQHLKKKFILICYVEQKFDEIKTLGLNIFASIADIKEIHKRSHFLKSIQVSLQGRGSTSIRKIIGEDQLCMEKLNCSEILHLIKKRKIYLEERSFEKIELMVIIKIITNDKVEKCKFLPVDDSRNKNILINCHEAKANTYRKLIQKHGNFENYTVYCLREHMSGLLEFISGDEVKIKAFLIDEDGNHVLYSTSSPGECLPIIGCLLGNNEQAYIPRNLRKPIVDVSILQAMPRVYLLSGDLDHLDEDIQQKIIEMPDSLLLDINVDKESVFLKLEYDCSPTRDEGLNVGTIEYIDFETPYPVLCLEVIKGSLLLLGYENCDDLSSYISYSNETIAETVFFNASNELRHHDTQIIVINGTAGIGKTALLHSLSQAYDERYYVLFYDLADYYQEFKQLKHIQPDFDYLDFVFTKYTRTESCYKLLYAIYKYHRKIGKVILFIDSLDEVLPVYEKEVIDFIRNIAKTNVRIIIASRTISTNLLIDEMQVYPFTIADLSVDNIELYLKSRNFHNTGVHAMPKEFLMNPLLLKFLIFISENKRLDIANFEVAELYKKVILEKIKRYHDKMGMIYDSKIDPLNEDVLEIHRLMALAAIFGKEWLIKQRIIKNYQKLLQQLNSQKIKLGIIKDFRNEYPIFIHISFAEFLVAEWLSINLFDEENAVELYRKVLTECDTNIQYLFDSMVCKHLRLHMAIIKGNLPLIQDMYRNDNIPIKNVDRCGRSCLHLASNYCLEEKNYKILEIIINYLLRKKYDFQKRDIFMKWNWFDYLKFKNPEYFERACSFGSTSAIKMYLKFENKSISNIDIYNALLNFHFRTLLFLFEMNSSLLSTHFNRAFNAAINHGCLNAASELIQMNYGHNPRLNVLLKVCQNLCELSNVKNIEYMADMKANCFTALHIACMYGHVKLVNHLLQSGADVTATDDFKRTPLHYAVIQGSSELVHLLLSSNKIDLNSRDETGQTPLHVAVDISNFNVVKVLLQKGADINVKSHSGETVLHIATKRGSSKMCETLLKHGVKVDERNRGDSTAFLIAAEIGNLNILRLLLSYGADIEQKDIWEHTALHLAYLQGHEHVVRYLIKESNNLSCNNNISGLTPIEIVIINGKFNTDERQEADFEEGTLPHLGTPSEHARINAITENADSSLHFASKNGNDDVVNTLLLSNVDIINQGGSGETPLHIAVQNGNVDIVKTLLKHGVTINSTNNSMETALHYAVACHNIDLVELLLENGANVNQKNYDGKSPLHLAAKLQESDIAEILLRNGADVNETDYCEITPLHVAVKYQNITTVKVLLANNASINIANSCGNTALHIATEHQNADIVSLLLENGADLCYLNNEGKSVTHIATTGKYAMQCITQKILLRINIASDNCDNCKILKEMLNAQDNIQSVNNFNESLLHAAVESQNKTLSEILLEKGIDINLLDFSQQSALHIAVQIENIDIVKFLLKYGVDINLVSLSNGSALHIATEKENLNIVKALLDGGIDIDLLDSSERSALHIAVEKENIDIVKILLDMGIGMDITDYFERSALHIAIEKENLEIVDTLLEVGANMNLMDSSEQSPLHIATNKENLQIVKALLEGAVDFDSVNSSGQSALHIAVEKANVEIVEALLEMDGCINLVDSSKQSALHIAAENEIVYIVHHLLDAGIDINLVDSSGQTALHIAIEKGNMDICKAVLESGIDINIVDIWERTALHIAVEKENTDIARLLLENGAFIDCQDSDECTALHIAVAKTNIDMIKLLLENGIDINLSNCFGDSALHTAVEVENVDAIRLLLQNDVDINIVNFSGRSALHYVVLNKPIRTYPRGCNFDKRYGKIHSDYVETLLENKVAPSVLSQAKTMDCIQMLLENGININLVDECCQSALHIATKHLSEDVINVFLDNDADVNLVDKSGNNILHVASRYQNASIIDRITKLIRDINAGTDTGQTALHIAVEHQRDIDILKLILENGADINKVDYPSHTHLYDNMEYTKTLLENNADDDYVEVLNEHYMYNKEPDFHSKAALGIAVKQHRDFDILNVNSINGQYINKIDNFNQTTVYDDIEYSITLENNMDDTYMEISNDRGIYSNDTVFKSRTALDIAIELGNEDIINILSQYNAQVFRVGEVEPSTSTEKQTRRTNNNAVTTLKMAVVLEDYPEVKLSTEQSKSLQKSILAEVWKCQPFTGPQFTNIYAEDGAVLITCANKESRDWLASTISIFNPWNGEKFRIGPAIEILNTTKVFVWVPSSELVQTKEPVKILALLQTQNKGLQTKEWRIVHSKVKSKGTSIVAELDENSLRALSNVDFTAYLGFNRLVFKLIGKSKASSYDSASTSKGHYGNVISVALDKFLGKKDNG